MGIGYVIASAAVPLVSVIFGLILRKAALPVNSFFGYRTRLSQRNEVTWSFEQKTAGRLMIAFGAPMIVVSLLAGIFAVKRLDGDGKFWALIALVAVQTAVIALINLQVERRLKAAFDDNGEPHEG